MSILQSHAISIVLGDDPRVVERMTNRLTGEVLLNGGRHFMLVRLKDELSEPYFLDTVRGVHHDGEALAIAYEDETGDIRGTLRVQPSASGLQFDLDVSAERPVWMVEWRLSELIIRRNIVPALGGQELTSDMPAGTQLSYKYPFWLNAQFVIGETPRGGVWLRTMETEPRFKLIRVKREKTSFAWTIGFEADGPLEMTTLSGRWYLDAYEDDWRNPVARHRDWLEESFRLVPRGEHPHSPGWVKDINVILEVWALHREIPEPQHPFDLIVERLGEWAALHPPEETLLYLVGFAGSGIDSRAPDYNPSPKLGGRDGFRKLVDAAHKMGFRVMIHTNVLAMTYAHPKYRDFARYQVIDVHGRKQGWAMDIDGDWLTEPFFAYMNPGYAQWGEYMAEVLGGLIDDFGLDAVFLDQTLLAFNVGEGPNFIEGMRNHIARLQRAYPDVLFGGEGLHEQNVSVLPFAQIHGIDSIAEVQNMDDRQPWRKAHPVNVALFGKYTKYVAHLLTRHPSHQMFELQQSAYEELGVVPALALYSASDGFDHPGVQRVLKHARSLRAASEATA